MIKPTKLTPVLLCAVALMLSSSTAAEQENHKSVDFASEIRPIFENQCLRCHGPDEEEGGFRIDDREMTLEHLEPGDADSSDLFEYLTTDDEELMMPPPDDGGPLPRAEISLVKAWIDQGANWPEEIALRLPEKSIEEMANGVPVLKNQVGDQDQSEAPSEADAATNFADDELPVVIEKQPPSIWRAIGTLHPAAIHLPMGLLLAAGLFALMGLRGNFVMSDCAYYCLWLGTLGAIIGCVTGWGFTMIEYPKEVPAGFEDLTDMGTKLFWHRSSAVVMTVFALLLALFAASARNRDPDDGVGWKLGLILLAIGIGFVGHQGGKLTWKASHYNDLEAVVKEYIPGLFGKEKAKPKNLVEPSNAMELDDANEQPASGDSSTEGGA